jgi:hypothetical protein
MFDRVAAAPVLAFNIMAQSIFVVPDFCSDLLLPAASYLKQIVEGGWLMSSTLF